jgi:ABC-type transport system substrate-binding protein/ABC-type dipeptide/oligopeptide/nickel transport system permease subunit
VGTGDGRTGASIACALVAFVLLGPSILPPPDLSDFAAPSAADGGPPTATFAHPLGSDGLYRDVLSRLATGGRVSLLVAVSASLVASVVGVGVGVLAATFARSGARFADSLLMRLVDVLLALPFLLFVTLLGVLLGRTDLLTLSLVLGLTGWTGIARIVRARALEVAERDFVLAARALGASSVRIAWSHVLPNVVPTAAALATGLVGSMILAESVLSYLTVGVPPPTASWGRMLHEAETLFALRPQLVIAPALCIVLSTLAFHRLGEALRWASSNLPEPSRAKLPLDLAVAGAAAAIALWLPRPSPAGPELVDTSEQRPTRGGTLRLASFVGARSIDPALASDELSVALTRLVYSRLLGFDASGALVPELAESFAWSEDRRSLDLSLRRGLIFHDGAPLEARDVKRSIERALAAADCPGASYYASLEGFEDFRSGRASELAGVEVRGAHELRLRLARPDATLPSLLTLPFVAPVCPSSPASAGGSGRASASCGAGPFRVARFDPGDGARLERHEAHFDPPRPYLDALEWTFFVRPQVQRYRFERGELDLVRDLAASEAAVFRADPRWAPLGTLVPSLRVSAIYLNVDRPPFDNRWLRRAVSFAVDPTVLSRLRADIAPLDRVVPPALTGVAQPRRTRRYDPQAALAAMSEAGYPYDPATGRGGYPTPIEYLTVPDSFEQQSAEVYQQQLARVGLRIRLRLVSYATYLVESQRRRASAMGWAGWHADYPDPLSFFDPNLVSASIGEVSQNQAFFSDARLDQAIDQARSELDPGRRAALFAEAESIVHEEAPWVPTTNPRVYELRQPWVAGYRPNPLGTLELDRVWLRPRGEAARLELDGAPHLDGGAKR